MKEEQKMNKEIKEDCDFIRGAFVMAKKIVKNQVTNSVFMIKLSSIIQVIPFNDDVDSEECIFYTYKDCRYYVAMNFYFFTQAINKFIFEPENHWELHKPIE